VKTRRRQATPAACPWPRSERRLHARQEARAAPPLTAPIQKPPVTAPILSSVATQLDDALSTAALNDTERRAVARIVAQLEAELDDDLLAVWLYGSRARGEADPDETHHDRRSDIDLIAIVGQGRDAAEASWELRPRWEALVAAEGDSPPYYSLRFYDAEFLRDRRRIRDFFFQEVDRDKLVLAGGDLEGEKYR
jgi:predicted nucleotidyltransferase